MKMVKSLKYQPLDKKKDTRPSLFKLLVPLYYSAYKV